MPGDKRYLQNALKIYENAQIKPSDSYIFNIKVVK